jgi:hypothetical protein
MSGPEPERLNDDSEATEHVVSSFWFTSDKGVKEERSGDDDFEAPLWDIDSDLGKGEGCSDHGHGQEEGECVDDDECDEDGVRPRGDREDRTVHSCPSSPSQRVAQ